MVYVNTIVQTAPIAPRSYVRLSCLSGLLGSLLFLSGDMLFYASVSSGAAFHPYAEMARKSVSQLITGGALGPIAAVFSAVGMSIFYWTSEASRRKLAAIASALLAVMMVVGGGYHAVFTNFGFAAKVSDPLVRETLIAEVASLWNTISYPMYAVGILGTLLVYALVLSRKSEFPRWLLLFLPTTLSLASSVFHSYFLMIPAPFGGFLRGGWINVSFVLFFAICAIVFWNHRTQPAANQPSNH